MKITLVHSPTAGMQTHPKKVLLALLNDLGYDVTYCSVKDADLEIRLTGPAEFIVVAGGDGTVGRVAKIVADLPEGPRPLAVLPLGTANNIATSLGIKGEIEDIAAAWKAGATRDVSFGEATAHWGRKLFIEGVGLGSLACATTPGADSKLNRQERVKRGRIAFKQAMSEAKPERLYVTVDGSLIQEDVLLVEIMNMGYVGPSLHLAPDADAGDGVLDVVFVPSSQRTTFLAWLDALIEHEFEAPHLTPRAPATVVQGEKIVVAWRGTALRVDDYFPLMPGHTAPVEADPDPDAQADMVSIELAAQKLSVLTPATSAAEKGSR